MQLHPYAYTQVVYLYLYAYIYVYVYLYLYIYFYNCLCLNLYLDLYLYLDLNLHLYATRKTANGAESARGFFGKNRQPSISLRTCWRNACFHDSQTQLPSDLTAARKPTRKCKRSRVIFHASALGCCLEVAQLQL